MQTVYDQIPFYPNSVSMSQIIEITKLREANVQMILQELISRKEIVSFTFKGDALYQRSGGWTAA